MTDYAKPLPKLSDANRPFWDGCRNGKLVMQRCRECGHIRYPIQTTCPRCLSDSTDWTELSGGGVIFSKVVFHQLYDKAFAHDVPYNVVLVQLDEGPRMFSNVVGMANDAIRIGMRVQLACERVTDEVSIPRFRVTQ